MLYSSCDLWPFTRCHEGDLSIFNSSQYLEEQPSAPRKTLSRLDKPTGARIIHLSPGQFLHHLGVGLVGAVSYLRNCLVYYNGRQSTWLWRVSVLQVQCPPSRTKMFFLFSCQALFSVFVFSLALVAVETASRPPVRYN